MSINEILEVFGIQDYIILAFLYEDSHFKHYMPLVHIFYIYILYSIYFIHKNMNYFHEYNGILYTNASDSFLYRTHITMI